MAACHGPPVYSTPTTLIACSDCREQWCAHPRESPRRCRTAGSLTSPLAHGAQPPPSPYLISLDRLTILGPPGSGKGAQSEGLKTNIKGLVHLSTGELLRAEVAKGSDLGQQAAEAMNSGKLVDDQLVFNIVKQRLAELDAADSFLLDGFPRSVDQARQLQQLLLELERPLTAALFIDIEHEALLQRLLARGRADDTEETISTRLEVYNQQTAPVRAFYEEAGILRAVDGSGSIEEVAARVRALM